jgi:hypothetical protein
MKIIIPTLLLALASCSKTADDVVISPPVRNTPSDSDASNSPIGTNLNGPSYWATQLPFNNLFLYSKEWVSGSATAWDDGNPIAVDSDGWVTSLAAGQIARTQMFDASNFSYPTGRYVMTWSGQGTFVLNAGVTAAPGETTAGRMILVVTGTILLYITETDPSDYIRDIRIVKESNESLTSAWDPEFIDTLADSSCLRFMEALHTNGSTLQDWGDRVMIGDARYASSTGIPYEAAVSLCNESRRDMWVCVPHLATDAFVTSLADMVRDNLDFGLTCHVEYSNEVWNNQFAQAAYCESMGIAAGIGNGAFQSRLFYYSRRAIEVFGIFETSFGAMSGRLIRVLASQSSNSWTANQILTFEDAYLGADALAIAPYFGPHVDSNSEASFMAMTVDQLLDHVESEEMPNAISWMHTNFAEASNHGLSLVAYEGGQHFIGLGSVQNNQAITDLLTAANRHPRMTKIYTKYFESWKMSGGDLFVHFNHCGRPSRYGNWGAIEWQGQPIGTAPKAQAIRDFAAAHPRWW